MKIIKGTLSGQFYDSIPTFIFLLITMMIFITFVFPLMFSILNSIQNNEAPEGNYNFNPIQGITDFISQNPIIIYLITSLILGAIFIWILSGVNWPSKDDEEERKERRKKEKEMFMPLEKQDDLDFQAMHQHYLLFDKNADQKKEKTHWDVFKKK